jgi:hypothetical protein
VDPATNDDDFEGWATNGIEDATVANGELSGTTAGELNGDAALSLDSETGSFAVVEIRMRRQAGDTSRIVSSGLMMRRSPIFAGLPSPLLAGRWPISRFATSYRFRLGDAVRDPVALIHSRRRSSRLSADWNHRCR